MLHASPGQILGKDHEDAGPEAQPALTDSLTLAGLACTYVVMLPNARHLLLPHPRQALEAPELPESQARPTLTTHKSLTTPPPPRHYGARARPGARDSGSCSPGLLSLRRLGERSHYNLKPLAPGDCHPPENAPAHQLWVGKGGAAKPLVKSPVSCEIRSFSHEPEEAQ